MRRSSAATLAIAVIAAAIGPARADGPVQLKTVRPVAKGIAAFPRVVGGVDGKAAARINRALTAAEQGVGCGEPRGTWRRRTFATMLGPAYLSLLAYDDWYCGGAYPDTNQVTLVFDLATGAPIDWRNLFPAGVIETAGTGPGGGDASPVTVKSPMLWQRYAKTAGADMHDKQCSEVLADPPDTGLLLWPDAEAAAVGIMQAGFPHVVKACGPPEKLGLPELKALGADAGLLAAIDEAHRRGWYSKR